MTPGKNPAGAHVAVLMQRISNCDKIQNTILTPNKALNVLYMDQSASVISGRLEKR